MNIFSTDFTWRRCSSLASCRSSDQGTFPHQGGFSKYVCRKISDHKSWSSQNLLKNLPKFNCSVVLFNHRSPVTLRQWRNKGRGALAHPHHMAGFPSLGLEHISPPHPLFCLGWGGGEILLIMATMGNKFNVRPGIKSSSYATALRYLIEVSS